MKKVSNKHRVLISNTIGLYVVRFGAYFFGLITLPYQTRVLGPAVYSKIGIAMALMVYFQLLIDFGYILSATEDVARNKHNNQKIKEIYTAVTINKIFLGLFGASIFAGIIAFFPKFQGDNLFFALFFCGTFLECLSPSFVYRGLQDMTPLARRSIVIKTIATVLLFVFLRTPHDYIVIPSLNILSEVIFLTWSFYDLKKRHNVCFTSVTRHDLKQNLKSSSTFFLSRIAATLYTSTNVIYLNATTPNAALVGNYTSADRLVSIGKMGLGPIADSVYPYMVEHKDFRIIKKILIYLEPLIIIGCVVVGFFAGDFCAFILGEKYRAAGGILVCMLPGAAIILPDYLLGFPTLAALKLTKHANYSIYVSSGIHVINLCVFYAFGLLNAYTLAALGSVAVGIETLYRFIIVYKYVKGSSKDKLGTI